MSIIAWILVIVVAIEHLGIMGLEMFGSPETQAKSFDMDLDFVREKPAQTALQNQGIYNGMLGVTLLLSLFFLSGAPLLITLRLLTFFIMVVALFGGFTATRKIFVVQLLPALLAFISLWF